MENSPPVFISHSSQDKAVANVLCAALEADGSSCWIAPRNIPFGTDWSEAIVEAIAACRVMILLFSAHANDSPQVRREVQRAFEHGVSVIPVRITDVLPNPALEYYISSVHWLNAVEGLLPIHLEQLTAHVRKLLQKNNPATAASPPIAPAPTQAASVIPAAPPAPNAAPLSTPGTAAFSAFGAGAADAAPTAAGSQFGAEAGQQPGQAASAPAGVPYPTASAPSSPADISSPPPNNLPHQVTSFIGREKEMTEVKTLLGKTRLLTLTGGGGSGKTRLSLQVAEDVVADYPDGAWLIELAPLADPSLVAQSVAQTLRINEDAGRPLMQTLAAALKTKRLLLLLDNCEHLLDACAQLANTLLRGCPHLKILASSREGLAIAGEITYLVPSLSLPDPKQTITPESLAQYEAIRLFVDRATAVLPAFAITKQNATALASVCYRLDGIPLALELAAARTRSLAVEDINSKLDNRFRLLTGGDRSALPRQQTLRALIDWSYDLLDPREKRLLRRLSVFAGGWTLEASEQIGAGPGAEAGGADGIEDTIEDGIEDWEVLDILMSLLDKSLVASEEQADTTRYRLLATVLQYAAEKLQASGEEAAVRTKHRDYFLALVEKAEAGLVGAEQANWLSQFESEHENLRAALAWCHEDAEGAEAGLRMASGLWRFWHMRGYFNEGREHLAVALGREAVQARTNMRATALQKAGNLAWSQGDYKATRSLFGESLAVFRETGDHRGVANTLNSLGGLAWAQGDYETAQDYYEQALNLYREIKDRGGIAASLNSLGDLTCSQGRYAEARGFYEQSLTLFRQIEHGAGIAWCLGNLGNVARDEGEYATARKLYSESLSLREELGDKPGLAWCLVNLGSVAGDQSDYQEARRLYEESLARFEELGNKSGVAYTLAHLGKLACDQGVYGAAWTLLQQSLTLRRELGDRQGVADNLEGMAAVLQAQEQARKAAHLWGTADALRAGIHSPMPLNERGRYEQRVAQARSMLGEDAFAAAWEEGRAMPWEQTVTQALKETLS